MKDALLILASVRAALRNGVLHYNKAGKLLETDLEILQTMRDEKSVRLDERFVVIVTTPEEELEDLRI